MTTKRMTAEDLAEIEADRLRKQRRRIIDTLNGFETDEVTK